MLSCVQHDHFSITSGLCHVKPCSGVSYGTQDELLENYIRHEVTHGNTFQLN